MDVDRLRALTKYIFSVPKYYASATAIILFSLSFGFVLDGRFLSGFLVFGVPAIASALVSTAITRPWSRSLLIRRSMFLALISMLLIAFFLFVPFLFARSHTSLLLDSLIMGQAFAFALSYFAILSITNINRIWCLIPASTQPLFQIGVLIFLNRFLPSLYFLPEALNLYAALAVFAIITGAVFIYIKVIDAPIRQAFGFSVFDLISSFYDHITSNSFSMERFFQSMGQSVSVPAGHLLFRDKETGKPKGMLLVPYVHPGPLGNLGASNVTRLLDESLAAQVGCLLVAHGPSTHDMNPTSAAETAKLADAARDLLSEPDDGCPRCTKFTRVVSGAARVGGIMIDGSLLAINTFSPQPTEDVELGVGLAAMEAGRKGGARDVIFIDAHNCFTEQAKPIHAGNPLSYDIISGVAELARKLSRSPTYPFKVGFGEKKRQDESLGPLGIRVCAMEIGGQKVALVVVDGNNLEAGLREKLMERLSSMVDDCEVMTSDNHSVNLVRGGFNPVAIQSEGLIEDVEEATKAALSDLSEATGRVDLRMIQSINVFGPGRIGEMVTTLNSMISMSKGFTIVALTAAIALCILIFIVIGSWAA